MIVFSKFLSKKFLLSIITTIIIYWTHWRWLLKYKEKQDEQNKFKEENNNATDDIM
jgi:hypothetical protein